MNKKITDAKVKKALEWCAENSNCTECPLRKTKSRCSSHFLGLINRQEEKMTELQELVDEMSSYFPACIDCEGKTKEGVRTDKCVYMIDNTNYCTKRGIKNISAIKNENRELKAEVERLSREYFTYKIRWAKATARIETAKAEAYKELGNKLEKAFQESERQMPNNKIVKQTVQICRNAIRIVLNELTKEDK